MPNKKHNNLYLGTEPKVKVIKTRQSGAAPKENSFQFTLTPLILEQLDFGIVSSDTDEATFSDWSLIASENVTVTINTDKTKDQLNLVDLLDAIAATQPNDLGITSVSWTEAASHWWLDGITVGCTPYPDDGYYDLDGQDNPIAWIGTSWMYYFPVATTNPNNPNGCPDTMNGFPEETMDELLLFKSNGDQCFEDLVLCYLTMRYTWMQP
jgi:hypothetical protein